MSSEEPSPEENSYSQALERRLAVPVLVSAVVSVPAIFLTMWAEGTWATIGQWANWLAGLFLWGEWILLIVLAENKLAWLRTHRWVTFVAAATLPAVIFALGPAQVLRLVQVAGTLRLMRVTRIVEAGGVLRRRMGLTGRWGRAVVIATTALSAVFVTAVLADPTSTSRQYALTALEHLGVWPLLVGLAATIVAGSTVLVVYRRWQRVRATRTEEEKS